MSAAADYLQTVGWKCYTTTRTGARFHVGLYDQQTGELTALIEANRLGQLRTGATTGVAAQWMANPEAAELGLFGAGWQAESQLEAVHHARPLRRVSVYCRDAKRRDAFADRMSQRLDIDVRPAEEPRQAVEGQPMVVTATTSTTPVFAGEWLDGAAFVAAVGSNWLNKAEIDVTTVRRAGHIVCDDIASCQQEAGDFSQAFQQRVFDWPQAVALADVVSNRHPGRKDRHEITLFKSVGMAIEDVALGVKAVELRGPRVWEKSSAVKAGGAVRRKTPLSWPPRLRFVA